VSEAENHLYYQRPYAPPCRSKTVAKSPTKYARWLVKQLDEGFQINQLPYQTSWTPKKVMNYKRNGRPTTYYPTEIEGKRKAENYCRAFNMLNHPLIRAAIESISNPNRFSLLGGESTTHYRVVFVNRYLLGKRDLFERI